MKKIYIVSLDDDVPLSDETLNKIKVLCYLVYDSIKELECDEYSKTLDIESNIIYNELLETKKGDSYIYEFKYNNCEFGKYEPFMVNNTSFAFTVNSDKLSENELADIIEKSQKFAMFHFNFKIDSITYEYDKKGKNRLMALKMLNSNYNNTSKKQVKIRTKSLFTLLGASIK